MDDDLIIGTNDDALISKYSCVQAGYLHDDYLSAFIKRGTKRPPIINRGTYTRTRSIDLIMQDFSKEPCQIISIGAGTDTRAFRLSNVQFI